MVARTGIEPVSLWSFFKSLIYNETALLKMVFLELFILTFILTCMASIVKRKNHVTGRPVSPAVTVAN